MPALHPSPSSIRCLLASVVLALSALASASPLRAETAPMHYFEFEADTAELERRFEGEFDLTEAMIASLEIAERRLDALGGGDLPYQLQYTGGETIGLFLRHKDAPQIAKDVFGIGADLSFRLVREELPADGTVSVPDGHDALPTEDEQRLYLVRREDSLSGDRLTQAQVGIDPDTKEIAISLQFDKQGAEQFAALTTANVGRAIAIVLDGKVLSAPIIREPILSGAVQIHGGFTQQEANTLSILLKSGALPAPFKLTVNKVVELNE